MNWQYFIPSLLTAFLTILGWFTLHILSKRRDENNKRKELRINYLIEAWRKLEFVSHREDVDMVDYLEKPIADIQLFGTNKQIDLAQQLAIDMANNNTAQLDELLDELRSSLRKELKLDNALKKLRHLRIIKTKKPNAKETS